MSTTVTIFVLFIALLHFAFFILETFFWKKPFGQRLFQTTEQFAKESAVLAANQGLYNSFLAAGLIWGLLSPENNQAILTFFLSCIAVAGIFGGLSATRSIIWVQATPALIALLLIHI